MSAQIGNLYFHPHLLAIGNYGLSTAGRVTSVLWWLATVLIVATYTANLAAFLNAERIQITINSIEDLVAQNKITYGKQLVSLSFSINLFTDNMNNSG